MPRKHNIKIRRGTAAEWSSSNPILDDGEIGYDKTNNNIKIGDGIKTWASLSYTTGETGPASEALKLNTLTFNGSTTTFALASGSTTVYPASAAALIISLNGVVQEPDLDYTVSGSNITFAQAPTNGTNFFGISLNGIAAPITAASITSGTLDIARIPTGSTSSTVCIGNDARLSDTRTPTDGSVTTAKLADDNVTYAKLQNVSATNRLLGRSSAGAGDVEELDAATARTVIGVQPTASPAFTGAATFDNTGNVVPLTVTNTGTANSFVVNDASGDTTPFVITAGGLVGIGVTPSGSANLEVGGVTRLMGTLTLDGFLSSAPAALTFYDDTDTGLSHPSADTMSLVTNNTTRLTISSTGTATFAGQVRVNTADSSTALLVNGATRGVRFNTSTDGTRIEGVDNTGVGSYQPLILNGSTVTIQSNGGTSAITVGTSQTATFGGQVLVTAGSVSTCSVAPSGDPNTGLYFPAADVAAIVTNGTERVRVDASGNVGIGAAAGSGIALDLYNATGGGLPALRIRDSAVDFRLYTSTAAVVSAISNHPLTFHTNNTERVRVDASGNVGIGTSPSYRLHVAAAGTTELAVRSTDTAAWKSGISFGNASAKFAIGTDINGAGDNNFYFYDHAASATRLQINSDGGITSSGVYNKTVGATNRDVFVDSDGLLGYVSSIRESKTDIVTLDDVSWLSALSPVSYRYRKKNADGTYSDEADGVTDYGLIAEDVEAVRPELCFYDDVDGEPQLRGVTYSKLITPMLRYIQQLEQRIAALEERLSNG